MTQIDELVKRRAEFLREAAHYFEKRDTIGEDMAFWANHQNAENCRKIADALETQAARVKELEPNEIEIKKLVDCFNTPSGYSKFCWEGDVKGRSPADTVIEATKRISALEAQVEAFREAEMRSGIYVASKTKHAPMWRKLRSDGLPIISTWIDEAGKGESASLSGLWSRCISEASSCEALLLYCESGEVLKGAWIELGAALTNGVKIFAVGIEQFTVANHPLIFHHSSIDEALDALMAALKKTEASNA